SIARTSTDGGPSMVAKAVSDDRPLETVIENGQREGLHGRLTKQGVYPATGSVGARKAQDFPGGRLSRERFSRPPRSSCRRPRRIADSTSAHALLRGEPSFD